MPNDAARRFDSFLRVCVLYLLLSCCGACSVLRCEGLTLGAWRIPGRPEVFENQEYLLKSIHYAATHRVDQFTLPCNQQVPKHQPVDLYLRPWCLRLRPSIMPQHAAAPVKSPCSATRRCFSLSQCI